MTTPVQQTESHSVSTIHRIYHDEGDAQLILRDPTNRRSFINKSAYAKLHRSLSTSTKRHSVEGLRGRFENHQDEDIPKPESFTPASFGYPKASKLKPPLIKPKPQVPSRKFIPKDVNSNVVADEEEVRIVLQPTASQESVDKIAKELSSFTMDGKSKRRPGSFKKIFGGLFSKEKKKTNDEKNKSVVYADNIRNETNFNKQEEAPKFTQVQEQDYAQFHVNKFKAIRESFNDDQVDNYIFNHKANDYISSPVKRFIDTSSSASVESEQPKVNRDTPPRAQETYQNIQIVNPKLTNSIERFKQKEADDATNQKELEQVRFNAQERLRQTKREQDQEKARREIDEEQTKRNLYQERIRKEEDQERSRREIEEERTKYNLYQEKSRREEDQERVRRKIEEEKAINYLDQERARREIEEEQTKRNVYQERVRREEDQERVRKEIEEEKTRKNLDQERARRDEDQEKVEQDLEDYPRTIERNLNKIDTKSYPEKQTFAERPSRPKISLEKLKLPQNREIYEPQPRVKSPIPLNRISTDKIIATELLKSAKSPTPTRRHPEMPSSKGPIITNVQIHHTPQRAPTPVDLRMSVSMKMSPQKPDVRKSVEEFYWKQLKKLKEEEDSKLYQLQMNGYYEEQARLRRSRSLSPNSQKARRSLSLPRERNYEMVRLQQQAIPEDQALKTDGRIRVYNQNFVRQNFERRSIDSLQRPIFRRGSLTQQEIYESNPYNKRVSFSNSPQPSWPTRNGYTQSPPQRRLDSELEDDVFYEPTYTNRVSAQLQAQMGARRLSMDSLSRQDFYGQNRPLPRRPISNISQYDEYGRVKKQPSNSQLYHGVYGSRGTHPQEKQITVRNKFCDIYGQIHDGIVMGQVQQRPPVPPRHTNGFVRAGRLTASSHDLGRRQFVYDTNNYENRPLPPLPIVRPQVSDTESSDASEIQRIMQKNKKKRGLFGK